MSLTPPTRILLGLLLCAGCSQPVPEPRPAASLETFLATDTSGFARATGAPDLRFPADHAAHPDYRSEWWYLTGNLDGTDGTRYGFQFTIFRFALAAGPAARESAWASNQAWMGHLALSTPASGHHSAERFSRGALGLAGAEPEPLRVWLEDWQIREVPAGWQLQAQTAEFGLDLLLQQQRPVVLQGEAGLSRKGPEPGNASHYYSIPRLVAGGTVRLNGRSEVVSGLAWLDREWSTSALGPDLAGWDWFALQFEDGRDLMFYRLRRRDGSSDPLSRGSLSDSAGGRRDVGVGELALQPLRWWQASDGTAYPVAWQLRLDAASYRVEAVFDDQLMEHSVRYWEGMVDVIDSATDQAVGRGYLELAGY